MATIHHPTNKPILSWSVDRLTAILTDPQRQKILCKFQIRTQHNGRELSVPEIALPETNETQAVADARFSA